MSGGMLYNPLKFVEGGGNYEHSKASEIRADWRGGGAAFCDGLRREAERLADDGGASGRTTATGAARPAAAFERLALSG